MTKKQFRDYQHGVMVSQIKNKIFFSIFMILINFFIVYGIFKLIPANFNSLQRIGIICTIVIGIVVMFYLHWTNCLPYGNGRFLTSILGLNATFMIYHIVFFFGMLWLIFVWLEQGKGFIDVCISMSFDLKIIILSHVLLIIYPSYLLCKIGMINPNLTRDEKEIWEKNKENYYSFLREKRNK